MDQRLALYEQRAKDFWALATSAVDDTSQGVNTHRREAPSPEISLLVSWLMGQRSARQQSDESTRRRPEEGRTTRNIRFGSFMTGVLTQTSERKPAPSEDD